MHKELSLILGVFVVVLLTGCVSSKVVPVPRYCEMNHIAIENNDKVIVSDLLDIIRDRFEKHGITTEVIKPYGKDKHEYIMTYVGYRKWDCVSYLRHAEIRIRKNGKLIGECEYHLFGGGGLDLRKFYSTKTKMNPVIDELLKEYPQKKE